MPDTIVLPLTGSDEQATAMATVLANSVLHLFQSGTFVPTPASTLADFTTAEATYSGYATVTIASMGAPFLLGNGWALEANERFDFNPVPGTPGNSIAGWYLVSAGGKLELYGTFSPTRPMQVAGNTCFVTVAYPFPAGQLL